MTATIAKSAAPKYAVLCWADERSVYAELPSINGPYVASFARSEGGLSQALQTLGAMHMEHSGEPYLRPELPSKVMQKAGVTSKDLDEARVVLRKMGVL
jgi:hypothetical protein